MRIRSIRQLRDVYSEYHQTMLGMETELTTMHRMVNSLYEKQKQLESLLGSLPAGEKFAAIKKDGDALLKKMKAWDEDMVQRKSKAYDDVENFPNKFTANYLFLINQTESDIPRVNQPSLDRMQGTERPMGHVESARHSNFSTATSRHSTSGCGTPAWAQSGKTVNGLTRMIRYNPRFYPASSAASFGPQRNDRIDTCCAACRDKTRQQRHC